jgi:hypothetical protein
VYCLGTPSWVLFGSGLRFPLFVAASLNFSSCRLGWCVCVCAVLVWLEAGAAPPINPGLQIRGI